LAYDGPLEETGISFRSDLGFILGGISVWGSFFAIIGILGTSLANPELPYRRTPFHASITGLYLAVLCTLNESMVPERSDIFSDPIKRTPKVAETV
jgi:hypothetical protein